MYEYENHFVGWQKNFTTWDGCLWWAENGESMIEKWMGKKVKRVRF